MFEFFATQTFIKSLRKLDSATNSNIKERLRFLSEQENPLLFAKKIKGYKNVFRFRSGDYRILFDLNDNKIFLLLAKHRKEIYKNLQ